MGAEVILDKIRPMSLSDQHGSVDVNVGKVNYDLTNIKVSNATMDLQQIFFDNQRQSALKLFLFFCTDHSFDHHLHFYRLSMMFVIKHDMNPYRYYLL